MATPQCQQESLALCHFPAVLPPWPPVNRGSCGREHPWVFRLCPPTFGRCCRYFSSPDSMPSTTLCCHALKGLFPSPFPLKVMQLRPVSDVSLRSLWNNSLSKDLCSWLICTNAKYSQMCQNFLLWILSWSSLKQIYFSPPMTPRFCETSPVYRILPRLPHSLACKGHLQSLKPPLFLCRAFTNSQICK